jgi:hypothetical protein
MEEHFPAGRKGSFARRGGGKAASIVSRSLEGDYSLLRSWHVSSVRRGMKTQNLSFLTAAKRSSADKKESRKSYEKPTGVDFGALGTRTQTLDFLWRRCT